MPLTRLPLTTGVSGTLAAGNGGTGVTSADEIGNLVLLNTTTISSATSNVVFDNNIITSDYDDYEFIIYITPATTGESLQAFFSNDNGSSYVNDLIDQNYIYRRLNTADSGDAYFSNVDKAVLLVNAKNAGLSYVRMTLNNTNSTGYKYGEIVPIYPNNTSRPDFYRWGSAYTFKGTSAVNTIKFQMSSGNISSGTIKVYGIRK